MQRYTRADPDERPGNQHPVVRVRACGVQLRVQCGRQDEQRQCGQHGRARAPCAVSPPAQQWGRRQLTQRTGAHRKPQRLLARTGLQLQLYD